MPIPVVAAGEALVQFGVARARCLTAAGHLLCVSMLLGLLQGPKRRILSGCAATCWGPARSAPCGGAAFSRSGGTPGWARWRSAKRGLRRTWPPPRRQARHLPGPDRRAHRRSPASAACWWAASDLTADVHTVDTHAAARWKVETFIQESTEPLGLDQLTIAEAIQHCQRLVVRWRLRLDEIRLGLITAGVPDPDLHQRPTLRAGRLSAQPCWSS